MKVLIIDDDRRLGDMLGTYLQGQGVKTEIRLDGTTGLDALDRGGLDAVVLDVMLPDIDGWKLLMRLYENPATRPIPVIVCTVVREEELGLSLGATLYLTKPVRPRQFIQALDQALYQASARVPRAPTNNAAAC